MYVISLLEPRRERAPAYENDLAKYAIIPSLEQKPGVLYYRL